MIIAFSPLKNIYFSSNHKKSTSLTTPSDFNDKTSQLKNLPYSPINDVQCNKISKGDLKAMNDNRKAFIELRNKFCNKTQDKIIENGIDCWNFYINSTDENLKKYQKTEEEVSDFYKDQETFDNLSKIQKNDLGDKHLNKQAKELLKAFDEELNTGDLKKDLREKENEIAAKYNAYVPKIDGKEISKTEIGEILQSEKDPTIREKAYNAKIKGGDVIAKDMVDFVKMRNEFAKTKGYDNFFDYNLKEEYDVEPKQLQSLMEEVSLRAKDTNEKLHKKNQETLSKTYGIDKSELKAYHYGLLPDDDPEKEINNNLKSKEQVVDIAKKTYANMGYDVDSLPITLDLFPRKNKNTHGFCFDIQAGKDARVLANLTNDTNSLDTICHELGHCVYHLGISPKLSFLDQTASSPAMTEAIAMMMGDLQQKENILKGVVPDKTINNFKDKHKEAEAKFINRSMLIINFEKEMYKNPDQDLSQLWHDLKCKYLGRNKSEPLDNEWATIPHYLSHPAYYQNYFRADLMKAQIYNHMVNDLGPISENNKTAEYMDKNIFECGKSIDENDLIEKVTGEPLSSKALCDSLK